MAARTSPSPPSSAANSYVLPTNNSLPPRVSSSSSTAGRRFLHLSTTQRRSYHHRQSAAAGYIIANSRVRVSWSPSTNKLGQKSKFINGRVRIFRYNCSIGDVADSDTSELPSKSSPSSSSSLSTSAVDCVGTGHNEECLLYSNSSEKEGGEETDGGGNHLNFETSRGLSTSVLWEWAVLVSPFFFWGTAMVAMKHVVPKAGPFFVGSFRLIPAGFILIAYAAAFRGRAMPSGFTAWLSITLFGLIDAACFQGFLAEGLQKTSAGLGSVIIDSQPLTVAILASLLFGESIDFIGALGLLLGVAGLLLLEVPALALDGNNFSFWGSGELWMLLAAQSMAVGTVMVRWVSKFADPVMATGWHMVIGGFPLVAISIVNHDPALSGSIKELTVGDFSALLYTSICGSAVSYGVFFYNATKGSLTKLSSLTFLTPLFASVFGFIYLGETYSPMQLVGTFVTLVGIFLVNYEKSSS